MSDPTFSSIRQLPYMGVIRVNHEAITQYGYQMGDPAWSNLGQGQPEVGEMEGAPERYSSLAFEPSDHAYGPIEGTPELREAIANHYNRLYRVGKMPYTAENVAVAPGGRAALTRIGAVLEKVRLGYFTPDYTAYEDLLTTFPRIEPVLIPLDAQHKFMLSADGLRNQIQSQKLQGVLISNPCNPTGAVVKGDELKGWVDAARETDTTLLMDEFYSHFIFDGSDRPVSSAEFVQDVNSDPVILVDGLTKSFRYPGWRVGWVVAPKAVIEALAAAGSFLDGGPCRPIQRAACAVLEPTRADQETQALRSCFAKKQKMTLDALQSVGIRFPQEPISTFYAFGDISGLPDSINNGLDFMRAGFGVKVLTVPGEFFDVNPHRSRTGESPYRQWVRFSFGPPAGNLEAGLNRLCEMIRSKS